MSIPSTIPAPASPLREHRLASQHLGNERTVSLLPPRGGVVPQRLVVFLDAERYFNRVDVLLVLDALIGSGVGADALFAFVSEHSSEARWRESPCHPPFARFVSEELLPWLESQHDSLRASTTRVLTGLSYTGLAASYVAWATPGRWTHVISQSGSYWSDDNWLTARVLELSAPLPTRFHLDVGRRETQENVRHREDVLQVTSQIEGVGRFRDALRATGHAVEYVEFDGAHEYSAWRETLPGALRWALHAPTPIST